MRAVGRDIVIASKFEGDLVGDVCERSALVAVYDARLTVWNFDDTALSLPIYRSSSKSSHP